MKISIIIPVYNKADYLDRCFESLFQQDFDDFEVVAVNDGSTDDSGRICDETVERDPRLRVIHTVNSGVTAARRRGVEEAKGKYVVFVDADDRLLPHGLTVLYESIESSGADEVIARFCSQEGTQSPVVFRGEGDVCRLLWYVVTGKNRFPVLWACIFRREVLDGVLDIPREIIEGEDKLMQIKILAKRPKVVFSEACVYEYQVGVPNSRRKTVEREQLFDEILRKTLAPFGQEMSSAIILHQLKEYETFLYDGRYDVKRSYYQKVISSLPDGIPLFDRMIWSLPPVLARPLVILYRRVIKIMQKGL